MSDHHPLLVSLEFSLVIRRSSFKFFKAWTTHDDCRCLVVEIWQKEVVGSGMHRLQDKLHRVKAAFKLWNKSVFGDVHRHVKLAYDEVNRIQLLIDSSSLTDELYDQELQTQLILTKALNSQDQYWREKARDQRFMYGDCNTAYFHRVAKINASSQHISFLQNGDERITTPAAIESHILSYFQNIFGTANNCIPNDLILRNIMLLVSPDENAMLMRTPLLEEIKSAVFGLNSDGAPGPDGFGGHFYQIYWDIVASDVVSSVQQFFYTDTLIPNLNSNVIVLIPKVAGAVSMGDFRPIALANFQFKIITKILADRLAIVIM